jgi:hypothetical protein
LKIELDADASHDYYITLHHAAQVLRLAKQFTLKIMIRTNQLLGM